MAGDEQSSWGPEDFGLNGKRILVTGASSGIGQATCYLLACLGVSFILVGRNPVALQETLDACTGTGHRLAAFDFSKGEDIQEWMQCLAAEGGPIYGLVHSAGTQLATPLRTLLETDLESVFQLNVMAGFHLAKAIRHRKVRDNTQSLVFVSSVTSQSRDRQS